MQAISSPPSPPSRNSGSTSWTIIPIAVVPHHVPRRVPNLFGFWIIGLCATSIAFHMNLLKSSSSSSSSWREMRTTQTQPPLAVMTPMTAATTTMSTTTTTNDNKRTIAIYICNDVYDERQMQKIQQLQLYFGPNDLFVVTDQENIRHEWILTPAQIIAPDSNIVNLTANLAFNFKKLCCGIERTIMWMIENRHSYDYAWVMEDDVHWTNVTDFHDFLESHQNDRTDLLHQNPGMEDQPLDHETSSWWGYKRLRPPHVKPVAEFFPPFYQGLFQFYRMSSQFVQDLNDWRVHKNNGEWTFFEGLFANLAFRNDTTLTSKDFIHNAIGYEFHLEWRPCYSFEHVDNITNTGSSRGGLFHPVKKDALSKNCRLKPKPINA